MKQVPLFPDFLPEEDESPDAETAPRIPKRPNTRSLRPRPKPSWKKPPELFPEHAEKMRKLAEATVRAARIAADRSAAGSPGRRPMVRNLVSGLICVVRREVWGSREELGKAADVDPEWIRRLEREPWSGRVTDILALETQDCRNLRRCLGLNIVELINLEERRLDLEEALASSMERAEIAFRKYKSQA